MDDFSVSVTGDIDILGYLHILILVNPSKFSAILHKLLSALGVSSHSFCPKVGK